MSRVANLWTDLVGVRLRSVLRHKDTWRTFSSRGPFGPRSWTRTAGFALAPRRTVFRNPMRPSLGPSSHVP